MTAAFAWLAGSRVGRMVAAAGALVVAVLLAVWRIRAGAKKEARYDALEEAYETEQAMREANADARRSDVRDRLRDGDF